MRLVAIQSNYIPWKGYFDLIHDADAFVFYDEVKYTKNDWRNRNRIYTRNGLQWLSIPISKYATRQKISEVELLDSSWQDAHYKSLSFGYRSSPHFKTQLEPLLNEMYLDTKWKKLIDVNRFGIRKISSMLGIQTEFHDLKNFKACEGRIERLVSLLREIGATEYISGPSGADYLSEHVNLFEKLGIQLSFKDYSNYPQYRQLSEPFEHYVSILDMVANEPLDQIPYLIWKWRENARVAKAG